MAGSELVRPAGWLDRRAAPPPRCSLHGGLFPGGAMNLETTKGTES